MYSQEIIRTLGTFDPISLQEMNAVQLMNRVDTKFIIPVKDLATYLELSHEDYFCQDINGVRAAKYDTIYFDTKGLEMYMDHQNGRKKRLKIRKRCYTESQLSFLEIKKKNNKGRTNKVRIRAFFEPGFSTNECPPFIESNTKYKTDDLIAQINVTFNRITLVNKGMTERLTIDYDILFKNLVYNSEGNVPEMCIVEIKQNGYRPSPFKTLLNEHHIKKQNISKYCLGTVLTNPVAKYNSFKRKIMQISRTLSSNIHTFSNYIITTQNG